jgi:hypothetical protein
MPIGPIFFPEILFFDFLAEWAQVFVGSIVPIWEGEIEKRDLSFPK